MKYELRVREGNYNNGKWDIEWDFKVDGKTVFPDSYKQVNIDYVSYYFDYITISLNAIPNRIDVTNSGDIWLHGEKYCELHKKPYKSPNDEISKAVFTLGEQVDENYEAFVADVKPAFQEGKI